MASEIVTLQDDAGNNLYPQIKWSGITDFPGFPKLPTDYLKQSDLKVTVIPSSAITPANGARIMAAATKGMKIEFPSGDAILYVSSNFSNVTTTAAWTQVKVGQLPTSYLNGYKDYQGWPAYQLTKGVKWATNKLKPDGGMYIDARDSKLDKDQVNFGLTLYLAK